MKPLRLPTTARIALLSILLALATNFALLGFIRVATQDDAMAIMRQRVSSDADVLRDTAASDNLPALGAAILDAVRDDPHVFTGLLDRDGRVIVGNISRDQLPARLGSVDFKTIDVLRSPRGYVVSVGYTMRPGPHGEWIVVGREFDQHLELQDTLERSLLLALLLSIGMGIVSGALIARYVGSRVETIARVVDEVGAGDLTLRARVGPSGDAFDQLSSRINSMLDRLGLLMSELRMLTDTLAHDLRSPVGRLRARIEAALTVTDETQRDQLLGGVLNEADNLTRMLTTVLEIGRSEAQTARSQFVDLDPAALIAELGEMYEPLAEEKGVVLSVDAAPLKLVSAHRQLLAQALSNLVDNALYYGAGAAVTLSARDAGGDVRLTVADNGPGIAEADMTEARRRFGRLDASRGKPGAGLGLSLAEAVAHLHGGRLELADNGPGLAATLILPR
ncbi:sensor histidine kinase [Sphingomonas paeninsulae]|uniref:histidine kinase n=1 Tax=Sphingomonas paeninsulae TaxID=2319844 RepID=A0A494TMU1_SPHPE|nr:HAMP domain-containing sensor histidine kinase [Sphingomonas paeninsulae]AYJ87161.1 sensor histidine kinase [Sphingomonas paeninsulae]